MAKRLTDSDKWKKTWFWNLPNEAKLVWIYILDNCDHAGLLPANLELLSAHLKLKITEQNLFEWFQDRILKYGDYYFIPSFLEFQYKRMNPNNKVHESVFYRLVKIIPKNLFPVSAMPLFALEGATLGARPGAGVGAKEKEEEKDKAKAMEKEKAKDREDEGLGRGLAGASEVYGKDHALEVIKNLRGIPK